MDNHIQDGAPRRFDLLLEDRLVGIIFEGLEVVENSCEQALRANRKMELAFEELLELYAIPDQVESWTIRPQR